MPVMQTMPPRGLVHFSESSSEVVPISSRTWTHGDSSERRLRTLWQKHCCLAGPLPGSERLYARHALWECYPNRQTDRAILECLCAIWQPATSL